MPIEKTLVIIKPDGVQRRLVGEIIRRYEQAGLRVVALKIVRADAKLLKRHYPDSMAPALGEKSRKAGEHVKDTKAFGLKIVAWLRAFIMSGPVVAMLLEGENAIEMARKIGGYTDPSAADKGTIRGDLGQDSILAANREHRPVKNLLHIAGNKEEARREIGIWFTKKELEGIK